MPLGFGFGIGTRNYNDISDDDESDDGGYAIAPLAGAAHYRETASRGAVTVTRGGAAPVIRHQPPSLAAAASPEPPSAVRVTRGGAAPVGRHEPTPPAEREPPARPARPPPSRPDRPPPRPKRRTSDAARREAIKAAKDAARLDEFELSLIHI